MIINNRAQTDLDQEWKKLLLMGGEIEIYEGKVRGWRKNKKTQSAQGGKWESCRAHSWCVDYDSYRVLVVIFIRIFHT